MGLSLRDIDYCVRSIALVGKNLELRHHLYPWLTGLLIPLKLTNLALFKEFIQGQCLAGKVMDYLDDILPTHGISDSLAGVLDAIEADLYSTETANSRTTTRISSAID